MAMTPLERKRRSLARKAERARLAGDPSDAIVAVKFYQYLSQDGNWESEVLYHLEWAGIKTDALPVFENDDDPDHDPANDGPYRGSIGRAERMVGMFLDAASGLAAIINRYKRQEIDQAIARIEASDLADPATKKKALKEIVRLNKIRDQLDKQVRRTIPQWKVKGD